MKLPHDTLGLTVVTGTTLTLLLAILMRLLLGGDTG